MQLNCAKKNVAINAIMAAMTTQSINPSQSPTPTSSSSASSSLSTRTTPVTTTTAVQRLTRDYLSASKSPQQRYLSSNYNSNSLLDSNIGLAVPEDISQCRAKDPQLCGNIEDLLKAIRMAFSEDQVWAIVFQFVTLYRNAIVLSGTRASSRASTLPRTDTRSNRSVRMSDSECGDSSDVDGAASDNSDNIISEFRRGTVDSVSSNGRRSVRSSVRRALIDDDDHNTSNSSSSSNGGDSVDGGHNSRSGVRAIGSENGSSVGVSGGGCSSEDDDLYNTDDGEGDNNRHDNEKPASRLDHMDYLNVPTSLRNFRIHKDGSVHVSYVDEDPSAMRATSQKQILMKLGDQFFKTIDYQMPADEEPVLSSQMEKLMWLMISEENYDEGIEGDLDTKEMDHILQICHNRIKTTNPESHYKAVCRALVAEVADLKLFLQKISDGETETMRLSVDAQASKQELDKLFLNDWALFWTQVLDELRCGIRLKKQTYTRAPVEYELTPYEMLMDDIRSKNYRLRKVSINGEIPQRVKNDAHAIILEFIRSRPPLKKASERKLAPQRIMTVCAREELLKAIRSGKTLKSIQEMQSQVQANRTTTGESSSASDSRMPPETTEALEREVTVPVGAVVEESIFETRGVVEIQPESSNTRLPGDGSDAHSLLSMSGETAATAGGVVVTGLPPSGTLKRNKQRRIEVDYSLLRDDDTFSQASTSSSSRPGGSHNAVAMGHVDSRKVVTKENDQNVHNVVPLRRQTDLVSSHGDEVPNRRHTIVGCHQDDDDDEDENDSVTGGRAEDMEAAAQAMESLDGNTATTMMMSHHRDVRKAPEPPKEEETDDRLSLTLEEIVHIRSVMTKAELEGLPIEVRIKEDVEKRKVCFLCLKTRFSIFGQWGVQCKLCQKTVCAKCYTKMRIPTEHFGNVPVVLLSPSLLNSPTTSGTSSPCHLATNHQVHPNNNNNYHYHTMNSHSNYVNEMDAFPKTLMERLMRPENDMKKRWAVGSAPASPRHHISTSSTPGVGMSDQMASMSLYQAPEPPAMLSTGNSAKDRTVASIMSRSMEGPRSLPLQSPARPHSVTNTLERRSRFAFMSSEQKESLRGELMAVCNDCRGLVLEIIRSTRQQTRSSARNRAIKKLTLDLEPVYRC